MITETQTKPKRKHLHARFCFRSPLPPAKQLQGLCNAFLPVPGKLMESDGCVFHRMVDRDGYYATWISTDAVTKAEYELIAGKFEQGADHVELYAGRGVHAWHRMAQAASEAKSESGLSQ